MSIAPSKTKSFNAPFHGIIHPDPIENLELIGFIGGVKRGIAPLPQKEIIETRHRPKKR